MNYYFLISAAIKVEDAVVLALAQHRRSSLVRHSFLGMVNHLALSSFH